MAFNSNFINHFYSGSAHGNIFPCTIIPWQGNVVHTVVSLPLTQTYYQPIQPTVTITSGNSDIPQSLGQQDQQEVQEEGEVDEPEDEYLGYQMNQNQNEFEEYQEYQQNEEIQQFEQVQEFQEVNQYQEIHQEQQSPLSFLQTNYNDIESLKQRHKVISQLSLNPKEKKSAHDDIRKSLQKLNRTEFMAFYIYLLTLCGYTITFRKPSKNSSKTFCLVYEEILDPNRNFVWSFEESINTINEYYQSTGKKRNNIRECAIVVEINIMLFLIEQLGGNITYGKVKKMGFHLLLTTENVLAVEFGGTVYTPNEMSEIGKVYYEQVIKPQVQ